MSAAAAPIERAGWTRPSLPWIGLGVVVALFAAAAVVFATRSQSETGADAREERQAGQLQAYRKSIRPITDAGASVVHHGLQPGVADIGQSAYPNEVLATMADGWVATLEGVLSEFEDVVPPSFLADSHWLYLRSIDGYLQAATALRLAVGADGEQRAQLVDLAASLGRSADQIYDRAESGVEANASRLGVTTSTEE